MWSNEVSVRCSLFGICHAVSIQILPNTQRRKKALWSWKHVYSKTEYISFFKVFHVFYNPSSLRTSLETGFDVKRQTDIIFVDKDECLPVKINKIFKRQAHSYLCRSAPLYDHNFIYYQNNCTKPMPVFTFQQVVYTLYLLWNRPVQRCTYFMFLTNVQHYH